jgi:hypothetical protein
MRSTLIAIRVKPCSAGSGGNESVADCVDGMELIAPAADPAAAVAATPTALTAATPSKLGVSASARACG